MVAVSLALLLLTAKPSNYMYATYTTYVRVIMHFVCIHSTTCKVLHIENVHIKKIHQYFTHMCMYALLDFQHTYIRMYVYHFNTYVHISVHKVDFGSPNRGSCGNTLMCRLHEIRTHLQTDQQALTVYKHANTYVCM